jgi:hypothetical protein
LAACAISMSDFGFWCCEAGMSGSTRAREKKTRTGVIFKQTLL